MADFFNVTTKKLPTNTVIEGNGIANVANNSGSNVKPTATYKVGETGDNVANNSKADLSLLSKATSKVDATGTMVPKKG